jgi:16S rRNA (guanine527-N7)-methyltransferase
MDREITWFHQKAAGLGIDLNHRQLSQFEIYKNELLDWNARTNLISESSAREIFSRHFLDSLTALPWITQARPLVIDIGSGAGFPGLPLKIARPGMEIYLLESNRKKVSFLKHIIRLLQLSPASIFHDRVENVMKSNTWKEKFDLLISRAAFKLDELVRLGDFFLSPTGQVIAWKSSNVEKELRDCWKGNLHHKIYQFIQHDIEADFLTAPRKIIIAKK